jgi:hypothetical protein
MKPNKEDFTKEEWQIVQQHRTPKQVQKFLTSFPYNWEHGGATLRSFREVIKHGEAHCLEAALIAAVILEQHNYLPLLLSFESQDKLDHVIFVFRKNGLWGAVGRSRDVGLHGRKPVFKNIRQLVWSYFEPYIDYTGRVLGYGVTDLNVLGNYDWRFSNKNIWKVENHLREIPHTPLKSSDARYEKALAKYKEFKKTHPNEPPDYYENKNLWLL